MILKRLNEQRLSLNPLFILRHVKGIPLLISDMSSIWMPTAMKLTINGVTDSGFGTRRGRSCRARVRPPGFLGRTGSSLPVHVRAFAEGRLLLPGKPPMFFCAGSPNWVHGGRGSHGCRGRRMSIPRGAGWPRQFLSQLHSQHPMIASAVLRKEPAEEARP